MRRRRLCCPRVCRRRSASLVGVAKEGLLALSVGVGLGVLAELMDEEVDEVVGPKGCHDHDRSAVRHGHEDGSVTLGGRRVPVRRPRARSADGAEEVALSTYEHFADRDALTGVVLERMLAGVSTRRYARTQEPVGSDVETRARSTSKSAVSRAFVARTSERLGELMSRRLDDIRLAVLMLDGIDLKGRCNVVALGITTEGVLCVLDGAKALRKAVRDVLGHDTPVQRCIRHKERNVLEHLAERDRPPVKRRLRAAWKLDDHATALGRLQTLADELLPACGAGRRGSRTPMLPGPSSSSSLYAHFRRPMTAST